MRIVMIGLACASVLGGIAWAGDLKSPLSLESTATLPAGVRNPRFINVFAWVGSRFADDGGVEPLGNALNKVVTWQDVLEAQEDDAKRTTVKGLLRVNEMAEDGSPGATSGEVNTFANVRVAALAFGVTERLTLVGVLPLVKVDVSASTAFVGNDSARTFVSEVASRSSPLMADEAASKLSDAVNQKLVRLGYEPIPATQTISGVGDAQLIAKYRLHDDGHQAVALKGTVILPTGTPPNPDKALDIPLGDGRFGLGLGAVYERNVPWDFKWNAFGNYTALLPRHVVKRVPTSVRDSLAPVEDKEEMFERLRSQFAFGTGLGRTFEKTGLMIGGAYSFQYMTGADYELGTRLAPARYRLLDDQQPLQSMHSLLLTAGFSTVEWYRQKKFFYPFQVNFSFTHPLAGRNVASNDLLAGELVLFF